MNDARNELALATDKPSDQPKVEVLVDLDVLFGDMPELRDRFKQMTAQVMNDPALATHMADLFESAERMDGGDMTIEGVNWSKEAILLDRIMDGTSLRGWIQEAEDLIEASVEVIDGKMNIRHAAPLEALLSQPEHPYWISMARYVRQIFNLKQLLVLFKALRAERETQADGEYPDLSIDKQSFKEWVERSIGSERHLTG